MIAFIVGDNKETLVYFQWFCSKEMGNIIVDVDSVYQMKSSH